MSGTPLAVAFPRWHAHPDVWMLVAILELAYLVTIRRRGRAPRLASGRQITAFTAGVAVLWLASDWPVHDLAEGFLYSVHMTQHLLLTLIAAPLLLLGTPAWLARRVLERTHTMGVVRALCRPVPGLLQFNAVLVLSHWPVVVNGTLRHHPLHFVAHAVLVVSALLMWMPVVSPLREVPALRPPLKMLYLFLQTILPTVPASFLTFGTHPLYAFYRTVPRLWGISVLDDQQAAGLIMKIAGGFFLWIVIAVIFFRWYAREETKAPDVLLWDDVERELKQLT